MPEMYQMGSQSQQHARRVLENETCWSELPNQAHLLVFLRRQNNSECLDWYRRSFLSTNHSRDLQRAKTSCQSSHSAPRRETWKTQRNRDRWWELVLEGSQTERRKEYSILTLGRRLYEARTSWPSDKEIQRVPRVQISCYELPRYENHERDPRGMCGTWFDHPLRWLTINAWSLQRTPIVHPWTVQERKQPRRNGTYCLNWKHLGPTQTTNSPSDWKENCPSRDCSRMAWRSKMETDS